jgi:hypothetical protein
VVAKGFELLFWLLEFVCVCDVGWAAILFRAHEAKNEAKRLDWMAC